MRTSLKIALFFLLVGTAFAQEPTIKPEEKNTKADKNVQTTVITSDDTNSALLMKISNDEKEDDVRRKVFLDELRKLYKANFL